MKPYYVHRRSIGLITIFLPVIVAFGAWVGPDNLGIQESVSHYYYTGMRDIFVAFFFSIGMFLLIYNPSKYQSNYGKKDRYLGMVAGSSAIIASLIPTACSTIIISPICSSISDQEPLFDNIHLAAGGLLVFSLAIFSYYFFPINQEEKMRKTYKWIGGIMFILILLMAIYHTTKGVNEELFKDIFGSIPYIYWLELLLMWAWGYAWFLKGKGPKFYGDKLVAFRKEAAAFWRGFI